MTLARLAAASAFSALATSVAFAGPIPYPTPGTVAPASVITAANTGPIMGFFVGSSASDTDSIRLRDVTTGTVSDYFFVNQTTAAGTSANFGTVNAGDVLVFELLNQTTSQIFASDPAFSADGINHAYLTDFGGGTLNGVNYAAGNYTYVGMEDLFVPPSDLDYNDDQFLFTNVSSSVTPEPGSLILLGTGLLGAIATQRRRFGM